MNHNGKMNINKWCALQEIHAIFSASHIFSLYVSVSVIYHSSIRPLFFCLPMRLAICLSVCLSISVSSISISLSCSDVSTILCHKLLPPCCSFSPQIHINQSNYRLKPMKPWAKINLSSWQINFVGKDFWSCYQKA